MLAALSADRPRWGAGAGPKVAAGPTPKPLGARGVLNARGGQGAYGEEPEIVDGLRGVFSDAGVVVVTHYQGLSVAEVTELRRGMRRSVRASG